MSTKLKKQYTINLNWIIKLKTNKIFRKGSRKKFKKNWIEKNKTWQIRIEGINWKQIKFL